MSDRINGWDERDYKLWGELQSLPSYGLADGKADNPMLARKDVVRLLEQAAGRRSTMRPEPEAYLARWRGNGTRVSALFHDQSEAEEYLREKSEFFGDGEIVELFTSDALENKQ